MKQLHLQPSRCSYQYSMLYADEDVAAGGFVYYSIPYIRQFAPRSGYGRQPDTGIGIAPAHQPYLFDRFYQVDAARIGAEGGNSGLGLAIVDWIVKAHGGSIQVESQVGQGSTFTDLPPLHVAM